MTALVVAVFLASVLGSLHCVGMCGAFLAIAFTDVPERGRWRMSVAYHGGRLVTYTSLGVAAGVAGSLLDLGGTLAGINRVALPVAGATIVLFGVIGLLRQRGVSLKKMPLPQAWISRVHRAQATAMRLQPTQRALAIGLLTTLLPCGWLYAFAATAAGTASPWVGGLVMTVFWSGTLPALVSAGVGVQALAGPVGRRLPGLTCVVLILIGGWAVFGRAQLDLPAMTTRAWASTPVAAEIGPGGLGALMPACHGSGGGVTIDPNTGLIAEDPTTQCGHVATQEAKP